MKQEELFLTREQSLHLQELGLDMKDAAFQWAKMVRTWDDKEPNAYKNKWRIYKNEPFIVQNFESWDMIPTYTLQEVLSKLPKSIEVLSEYGEQEMAYLRIDWSEGSIWYECDDYASYNGLLNNPLEGAYDMLCWVLEHGYLKTK